MNLRKLTSIATAAAVLVHVLLGCCAHHAHVNQALGEEHRETAYHDGHGHRHAADHDHDRAGDPKQSPFPDHSPTPGKCEGSDCVFSVSGKVNLNKAWFFGSIALSAPAAAVELCSPLRLYSTDWIRDDIVPRIRPHLLLQVLLI